MNLQRYKEIVQKSKPKTSKIKKILFSFISGGVIGIIGQFLLFTLVNLNVFQKKIEVLTVLQIFHIL